MPIAAENDLADIATYTLETWGEKQLDIYRRCLEKRLDVLIERSQLYGFTINPSFKAASVRRSIETNDRESGRILDDGF